MSRAERVEAAARAQCYADGNDYDALVASYGVIEVGGQDNGYLAVADEVLTASDAVLRTDAAVERVARALYASEWGKHADWDLASASDNAYWRTQARAAIAALLDGEA